MVQITNFRFINRMVYLSLYLCHNSVIFNYVVLIEVDIKM